MKERKKRKKKKEKKKKENNNNKRDRLQTDRPSRMLLAYCWSTSSDTALTIDGGATFYHAGFNGIRRVFF
jgi:hypothetical protein